MTSRGPDTALCAIRKYYKRVAPIYDATRLFFLFERKLIIDLLNLPPGDSVLEIGSGSNLPYIYRALGPSGDITGLDFSPEMLAIARRRICRQGLRNVQLIQADAGDYNLERRFQAALFSYSLSMMPRQDQALDVTHSRLDTGGKVGVWISGTSTGGECSQTC
ncbi:MAG: hypothetical protein CME25_08075 [Gemmatimonadetes bacterium]|nr:hypothetical protein [Gemmatimonadota bacterium]